jgi:hypothetical protein
MPRAFRIRGSLRSLSPHHRHRVIRTDRWRPDADRHEPVGPAWLSRVPPVTLKLTFNEPVAARAALVGPDGDTTDLTTSPRQATRLSSALPGRSCAANASRSWRVISLDGHPSAAR